MNFSFHTITTFISLRLIKHTSLEEIFSHKQSINNELLKGFLIRGYRKVPENFEDVATLISTKRTWKISRSVHR